MANLGPNSVLAARAAIAARNQGKYLAFHKVLMEANSVYDLPSILDMANTIGLDTERLRRDMNGKEIDEIIRKNFALADKLKLNGTPSFVIGDTLLRGARDLESLRSIVAEAGRRKNRRRLSAGLLRRLGAVERIQFHAFGENADQSRIGRQVAFIALGVEYLWNDTDINQPRRFAVSKRAGVAIVRQMRFQRIKTLVYPVLVPSHVYRVLVYTHLPPKNLRIARLFSG